MPDFLPLGQIRVQRLGAPGGQSRKPGSVGLAWGPLSVWVGLLGVSAPVTAALLRSLVHSAPC